MNKKKEEMKKEVYTSVRYVQLMMSNTSVSAILISPDVLYFMFLQREFKIMARWA
jgi:hypothetical protein